MKTIWQGRAAQAAARYGDSAPLAAVCCNACRTCATTNAIALGWATAVGAVYAAWRFVRRAAR